MADAICIVMLRMTIHAHHPNPYIPFNSGNSVSIGEKVVRSKSTSVFGHEAGLRNEMMLQSVIKNANREAISNQMCINEGPANYDHRVEERAVATNNV
ncbi:18866_t:CDS:2, partial [Acaulospora morrowiae]